MTYPYELIPQTIESLRLPSGKIIEVIITVLLLILRFQMVEAGVVVSRIQLNFLIY